MPSNGSASLWPFLLEKVGHAAGDDHSTVGHVVDQVVRHAILAALPDHDARRMQID